MNLEALPLQEVGHLGLPGQDDRCQLSGDFLLVLVGLGLVPFLEPDFSLPAEKQNEVDHFLLIKFYCIKAKKLN